MIEIDKSTPILLVDDDDVDVENVKREFKKSNISIDMFFAKDGVEALDLLYGRNGIERMYPPKVILLDINMPKMNGIELLKALRAPDSEFKHVSVYILTVSYNTHDKMATCDLNVSGYIVKPLRYEDILRIYWTLMGMSPA